jgi:arylformamidase
MNTRDPFRTRDAVPDFDRYVAEYRARSAATRARLRAQRNVAYGDTPAERLDLFFPAGRSGPAPVHLFIHGGYWRAWAKEDFSFVADTVTAAGAIAAILDYALMPAVRLEAIVAQVRRAAQWLAAHAPDFGGDPARLTISGHSAGAHLGCQVLDPPVVPIRGALLVSGVYELKPLQSSFVQAEIGLTDDEVARFSPVHATPATGAPITVLVGEQETAPFHDQAAALARRWRTAAVNVLPGANHLSTVRDLGTPGTSAAGVLARVIGAREGSEI